MSWHVKRLLLPTGEMPDQQAFFLLWFIGA